MSSPQAQDEVSGRRDKLSGGRAAKPLRQRVGDNAFHLRAGLAAVFWQLDPPGSSQHRPRKFNLSILLANFANKILDKVAVLI
jgi:hypothetical protein